MINDFTAIGFPFYASEDIKNSIFNNPFLHKNEFKRHDYYWISCGGPEVWIYDKLCDKATPFHETGKHLMPDFEKWDDNDAFAAQCYMHLQGNDVCNIPDLDVEIVNLFEFQSSQALSIQISAIIQECMIYRNKVTFEKDHPKMAIESYFVSPKAEKEEYYPYEWINGYIKNMELLTNPVCDGTYYHLVISSPFNFDFDCYADVDEYGMTCAEEFPPKIGDIFSGEVYFTGKCYSL